MVLNMLLFHHRLPYRTQHNPQHHYLSTSDTSSNSSSSSPAISQGTSCSSLQSNLSLQTLPSVPSLQKFSPETLNLSVTHTSLASLKPHPFHVNFLSLHNNFLYVASGNFINVFDLTRIKVWGRPLGGGERKSKHSLIATLEKHKSAVNALALNEEGSVLFSGACDRSILVWEREDSANYMVVTGAVRGHGKAILCFNNICDLLFSGSADRTVRIWQPRHDGKFCCLRVLDGHEKPVRSLAAMTDENWRNGGAGGIKVFSGSFDGEKKVWEVVVSSHSRSPPLSYHDEDLIKCKS